MPDFAVRTAFTAVDKVSPAFSRMERAAKGFGSVMSSVLPVLGVAVLANYASKAIDLASSLTEVQNVVDTTFGASANQINQWSQNAINQFGLSELQAKQFTGSLGAMMKSSGLASNQIVKMSTDLSGLAGDFASFYNLPIEEAFNKIRSGISGETEPLKQLGINMSVANMEAFALTQGIHKQWLKMSQAEQTQLRYAYLMKVSADAQGDFNKTLATSYANQKRVLGVQFDQALATLAKGILPSLTEAFKSLNAGMRAVNWESVGSVLTVILKALPIVIGLFVAWKVAILAMKIPLMVNTGLIWGAQVALWAMQAATWGVQIAQWAMNASNWANLAVTIIATAATWAIQAALWAEQAALWAANIALNALTAAQWLLNAAMAANPIGLIIMGIATLIGVVAIAIRNWNSFGAALMVLFGPIGMVISLFKTLYDRWEQIKQAFTTGGIVAGLKEIGFAILDSLLYPIQQLLELIAKIPGIGKYAAQAAAGIQGFREGNLNAPNKISTEKPPSYANGVNYVPQTGLALLHKGEKVTPANQNKIEAPNKSATELLASTINVNIYSNGTEAKAEVTPRKGATVNMNRLGYQQ